MRLLKVAKWMLPPLTLIMVGSLFAAESDRCEKTRHHLFKQTYVKSLFFPETQAKTLLRGEIKEAAHYQCESRGFKRAKIRSSVFESQKYWVRGNSGLQTLEARAWVNAIYSCCEGDTQNEFLQDEPDASSSASEIQGSTSEPTLNGGYTYKWDDGDCFKYDSAGFRQGSAHEDLCANATGGYTYKWDDGDCFKYDSTGFRQGSVHEDLCANATGGYTYKWDDGDCFKYDSTGFRQGSAPDSFCQ